MGGGGAGPGGGRVGGRDTAGVGSVAGLGVTGACVGAGGDGVAGGGTAAVGPAANLGVTGAGVGQEGDGVVGFGETGAGGGPGSDGVAGQDTAGVGAVDVFDVDVTGALALGSIANSKYQLQNISIEKEIPVCMGRQGVPMTRGTLAICSAMAMSLWVTIRSSILS